MSIIKNAANSNLQQQPSTLPQMEGAFENWYQLNVFTMIVKTVDNFKVKEVETDISFHGVIQPMGPEKIQLKPEGQRSWVWYEVHAEPSLVLVNDDRVKYNDQTFRVMEKYDYTKYGYVQYDIIEDYVE